MRRPYTKMGRTDPMALLRDHFSIRIALSYALDWVVIIAVGIVASILSIITPNKRPFSLVDPSISMPYTKHETVPPWLLLVLNAIVPIIIVAIVSLIFVPGKNIPANTPKSLIWKRKLWELHVGWLGLALSLCSAWWFTQGMKNMFGKPRPDLLARCDPDIQNAADHIAGGLLFSGLNGQVFYASICRQQDKGILDDGFRSYPSGHASSAAAGLTYLSLFLASKFSVTIPFVVPGSSAAGAHAAFPSRAKAATEGYEASRNNTWDDGSSSSPMNRLKANGDRDDRYNAKIQSLRKRAASPPVYLLFITIIPFCAAVFVAASRFWDFRHHGFDILFGFVMGVVSAVFSFRYYHLPIQQGAGWAWGPRSEDRAFWAGVGRLGYVDERDIEPEPLLSKRRATDLSTDGGPRPYAAGPSGVDYQMPLPYRSEPTETMPQRTSAPYWVHDDIPPRPPVHQEGGPFQDMEMQRI